MYVTDLVVSLLQTFYGFCSYHANKWIRYLRVLTLTLKKQDC